ncbi:TraR/DksA C4-type zinc finger protein [Pseudoxanthomonas mexicana]|uniref:TraR/DksA C4-type zinc finger protein n=1 Tax=Pseudoxanthomonas mexicana TaxID=128785 RepID=UPI00398BA7A3
MIDAADKVVQDDERAMELFLQSRQRHQAAPDAWAQRSDEIHCLDCGEVIPPARLVAMPHTKRCQPCASDVERR